MISLEDSYFFDQAPFRQPIKRYRKTADELPQSLKFAQLNPKLAGFFKDGKPGEDAPLPDIVEGQPPSNANYSSTIAITVMLLCY